MSLRRFALAVLLLPLVFSGVAAAAAEPLPAAISALLKRSGLPLTAFGIDVQSVDRADTVPWLALNAEQPFLLASTTKLVTSLAALDLLGKEHRWPTRAHTVGRARRRPARRRPGHRRR